ncbi:hypothetical protein ROHU_013435 [Labeo rohita]|uniref:Uncharacterized protein n=1 Tax=Labeo rohita TaxID=84645 RepID=A0A498L963_LABRO|nr:hypothetical protein ROHU_013435 [Labeo rohita]
MLSTKTTLIESKQKLNAVETKPSQKLSNTGIKATVGPGALLDIRPSSDTHCSSLSLMSTVMNSSQAPSQIMLQTLALFPTGVRGQSRALF